MTDIEKNEIMAILFGNSSVDEYLQKFTSKQTLEDWLLREIECACNSNESEAIQLLLLLSKRIGVIRPDHKWISALKLIAINNSHNLHDEIIRIAESWQSDDALPLLQFMIDIKTPYMIELETPYDLARRGLWAIAKIKSELSKEVMRSYFNHSDKDISSIALHIGTKVGLLR